MTYSEKGDTVTLEMTRAEYATLLMMLGVALGTAKFWMYMRGLDPAHQNGDDATFWEQVDFVNRMNAGNPNFPPYDIPEEFKVTA